MKFGCNTLYPRGRWNGATCRFGRSEICESIDMLKAVGYEAVEFSFFLHLNAEDEEYVRNYCLSQNIIPWSAHSWSEIAATSEQLETETANLIANLEDAKRLGVEIMVVHPCRKCPDPMAPERWKVFGECIKRLSPEAEKRNITVALENVEGKDELSALADNVYALNLPNIGFNVDTGHAAYYGMSAGDAIRISGPKLVTTHLQDTYGKKDDHLPPGRGTAIDWIDVRKALAEVGYKGVGMVELSDCPPDREPDHPADMKDALDFLKSLFV